MQGAVQAVLQQYPSTQWPLPQSADLVQVSPTKRRQSPPTQYPLAHSVEEEQPCPVAFLQFPAPSQALAPVQGTAALASGRPLSTLEQAPTPFITLHCLQVAVQAD